MYIYKTTNIKNGKIYVGLCTKSPEDSSDYFGSGILISKAIGKYGRDCFTKEIVEQEIRDIETLNEREIFWIAHYNSTDPLIGYNLSHGGKGTLGMEKSPETIEKIRIAATGQVQSQATVEKRVLKTRGLKRTIETRQKISQYFREFFANPENHPNFGKKLSAETRLKMSLAQKGRKKQPLTSEHKQKIRESNMGKSVSKETREKISKMRRNVTGFKHSAETKEKMKASHQGKFSGPSNIVCPHCGKIGSSNAMLRWHFNRCSKKS